MIVLAVSYMELILKDFFQCLFRAHPLRMNPVLRSKGNKKATVSLTEIVDAPSKDLLLRGLHCEQQVVAPAAILTRH